MREPLHDDDPARIGAYRLLGRLGEGGMGVVYLAKDPGGELVALKAVRAQLATQKDFRTRFRAELETAAKVPRFCTAPILDADPTANPPYVVTEYIDGPTLNAVVDERGPLSGSQLHALGVGVASALAAIHQSEVIHRDLKPGNVLLSRFGPRVIDFGIARSIRSPGRITQQNIVMGSPSFMAPEQWQGDKITPQVDIFAWGALMAFAGTGREPFSGPSDTIPYQIMHGEPDLDGLDPELKDLVTWAMHKNPDRRPSATQLLDALVGDARPAAPRAMHAAPTSAPPAHAKVDDGPVDLLAPGTRHRHRYDRRKVLGLWVRYSVLAVLLGGLATCAGVVYFDFALGRDGSVAAVDAYLDNVQATRFNAAYDQLCPEIRSITTREEFISRAEAAPQLHSYDVHENSVPFGLGNAYTVRATVEREGRQPRRETFIVVAFERPGPNEYLVCPRG